MREALLCACAVSVGLLVQAARPLSVALSAQGTRTFKARLSPVPIDVAMQATIAGTGAVTASLAGSRLTINGTFDTLTEHAVEMFQGPVGLAIDGVVNWYTWHAIVGDSLRSRDAAQCMQNVFQAWSNNDQVAASHNATPQALSTLFGRPWNAADGWTFANCGGAAGHVYCTWNRAGGNLVVGGPDPGGGPIAGVVQMSWLP